MTPLDVAYMMAQSGYGYYDLMVKCKIGRDTAKALVWEAEAKRLVRHLVTTQLTIVRVR